jgi:5-methylcytosine-specific restriction endonuclease McrA
VKRSRMKPVSDKRRKRDAVYPERRQQVWERANGMCEHCGMAPMGEVHHIAGRGGPHPDPHRLENLAGLCSPCHARVHREPEWARSVGLMRTRLGKSG